MALHPKVLREKLTELLLRETEAASPDEVLLKPEEDDDERTPVGMKRKAAMTTRPPCQVADFEVLKMKLAENFQTGRKIRRQELCFY